MTKPLLPFPSTCIYATFEQRVKRFSVECRVGEATVWAHTNNSGSMLGLLRKGAPLLLSPAKNADRKLPYTLELMGLGSYSSGDSSKFPVNPLSISSASWVGVNTLTPNRLLRAAFTAGRLPWAKGYTHMQPEAQRGQSRLDALFTGKGLPPLWVECKNVTMVEDGIAAFPDAVTERGQKHVREMIDIVQTGEKAAFFYCIQRSDAQCFAPADYIDMTYTRLFYEGCAAGVGVYAHHVPVSPAGIDLGSLLPVVPENL